VLSDCADFCVGCVLGGNAGVGSRMFNSSNYYGFAVRPVISLNSDITTNTISKTADQEEQDWSEFSGRGVFVIPN